MIRVYDTGCAAQVPEDYTLTSEDGTKSALIDEDTWYWYSFYEYGVGWEIKYHKFVPLVDLEVAKGRLTALERIAELEVYLTNTDWIIIKMQECNLAYPEELDDMRTKYSAQIQTRRDARDEINELQEKYGLTDE